MAKNYIVTGASGYLGHEICRYLIEDEKCNVLCVSRSNKPLNFKGEHKHVPGIDLLNENDLKVLQQEASNYFKAPFHIINSVGHYDGQESFLDTSLFEQKKIMDTNYTVVYNTVHSLLKLQIERGGGHFIAFSCDSTNYNYPLMTPFVASKSALNALIKGIANEFGKENIISNAFLLTTLNTQKETAVKPNGDHESWLDLKDIAQKTFELSQSGNLASGNLIKLYNYSDSFFKQSYFERIS